MTRRGKYLMIGITLAADVGVILLSCADADLSPVLRWIFILLPLLVLCGALAPWHDARPRTRLWVGVLLNLMIFSFIAGFLAR